MHVLKEIQNKDPSAILNIRIYLRNHYTNSGFRLINAFNIIKWVRGSISIIFSNTMQNLYRIFVWTCQEFKAFRNPDLGW